MEYPEKVYYKKSIAVLFMNSKRKNIEDPIFSVRKEDNMSGNKL